MTISVVVFSRNPKPTYFNKVLRALKHQTESPAGWELIVIDNHSDQPIANQFDFSWHPNVKHVVELNLGISHARARGIREASGELLIMVDDDAELYPDYIQQALHIATSYPQLGCFGGSLLSASNIRPQAKYKKYIENIGYRVIQRNQISNLYLWETTPAGPGLVIYAHLAKYYADAVENQSEHAALGRKGDSLMSSEDIDLAYYTIDHGYYNGVFEALKLNHLTIEEHLNDNYMIRRRFYNVMSSHMLNYIRFGQKPARIPRTVFYMNQFVLILTKKRFEYSIKKAEYRATREIRQKIISGALKTAQRK